MMKRNKLNLKAQDGNNATYYGKRNPEDGIICWDKNSYEIDRLIKASTNLIQVHIAILEMKKLLFGKQKYMKKS